MILHRVVAANVGPFVGTPVVAGPFAPGLNILAAPNESGKTTLLKATGRALFDRHTCKADEIKTLRPAGTTLAPAVTVEFETPAGRFRIEKIFLQGPRSELSTDLGGRWKPVSDGDAADERLNALLHSTRPGTGATRIAHWGMLGYLWMRQGEPAEWPDWHKTPAGQTVQGMLVKVELDPFIAAVSQRMWAVYTENFTPSTHQPKVGGTLLRAEEELRRVTAELSAVEQTRRELQGDQDAYDRLTAELPRLEEEHRTRQQQAESLREAARQAEGLKAEVDRQRHALAAARDRRNSLQRDDQAFRDHTRQSDEVAARLETAANEALRGGSELTAAREKVRRAEAARAANAGALSTALAEQARLHRLLRHRSLADEIAQDARTLELGGGHAATVARLAAERAEIPVITAAKLAQLEKLQGSISTTRAQVDALGLTVDLTAPATALSVGARRDGGPAELLPLSPGEGCSLRAVQDLTLELPGWGTIRVRTGANEARVLHESLARDETRLHRELTTLGASTLPELRAMVIRLSDLDARLEAARQALAGVVESTSETLDTLRGRLAQTRRQFELLKAEIAPTATELVPAKADLEAAGQTAAARCESLHAETGIVEKHLKECRESVALATRDRESADRLVLSLGFERSSLQRQAAEIRARYPEGLETALELAGENFALAAFETKRAEGRLPPDAETLPDRNRRASLAAEQVRTELDRARNALAELRGRLELQGSSGLHTRESDLRIRHDAITVQVAQSRSRSRAARLVHDLIERRQQAATRAVLAPLQERLGARFAEISGERDRRIFLDDSLVVRGLGRKDDELIDFADLSQGAKEQLLLCLRLAIAEELMAGGGGPQSLILDDVLVNTDPARQERILTMLSDAADQGLQILVCTCHPDRYRGIGRLIELRRTTETA